MADNLAVALAPPSPDTAVVILQVGGPPTLRDVRGFIYRMLSDRAILAMPAWLRVPLATFIAWTRAPRVRRQYARIGGGSPIRAITEQQAAGVEEALLRLGRQMPVVLGMRYSEPPIRAAVARAHGMGVRRLVALPLYPQYSATTTASAFAELERAVARLAPGTEIVHIRDWADDPGYIRAVAATVEDALDGLSDAGRKDPLVLFSAHGLPQRYVDRGDPYPERVAATVRAVEGYLGSRLPRRAVCFQSRVGPVKWLEPSTEHALRDAAASGATAVVLVPIAFVSDHLETLYEMDIEYRELAKNLGIPEFARAAALNDSNPLSSALAAIVVRTLARL